MGKRLIAAAGALAVLAAVLLFPLPVRAAGDYTVSSVEITAELHTDGSASMTEVWEIDARADFTEWYLQRFDLDGEYYYNLAVTDENGVEYENIGEWDPGRSFDEKAYKCGIATTADGYEICWGISSFGQKRFTVRYEMDNLVKGYANADVIYYYFLMPIDADIGGVQVTIYDNSQTFAVENTGVWAAGNTVSEIWVRDGMVQATTNDALPAGDTFEVLVQFADGMFHPQIQRNEKTFDEVLRGALYGTDYGQPDDGGDGDYDYNYGQPGFGDWLADNWLLIVVLALFVMAFVLFRRVGSNATAAMKPEYKQANYHRELPWRGNVSATWARLGELGQTANEGDIIGAFLLQWIRSRQVEIVTQQGGGFFGNKEEMNLKLYTARLEMGGSERKLYDMLVAAAGPDYVLQSKEFEKWSNKNYEKVQGWLASYKNEGKQAMRGMGAVADVPGKTFFGLINTVKTEMTPLGEQLTVEMFGFKKYLQEFTIINERQAREVQLWDKYLIFAQVFGIADEVAGQFKQLYPDYFAQMAQQMGMGGNIDMFDIMMINYMTRSYSRAMYNGYRAGYNAANVSRSTGGGGFSSGGSFGGGGGVSGGGASGGGGSGGGR